MPDPQPQNQSPRSTPINQANETHDVRLLRESQEQNRKLIATVNELRRQLQESQQRLRDNNNTHTDIHKGNCEAMLQTIVNLTSDNEGLRSQLGGQHEEIRRSVNG